MANNKSCLSCKHCKDERGEFGTVLARWCALSYYPLQAGGIGGCKAHLQSVQRICARNRLVKSNTLVAPTANANR